MGSLAPFNSEVVVNFHFQFDERTKSRQREVAWLLDERKSESSLSHRTSTPMIFAESPKKNPTETVIGTMVYLFSVLCAREREKKEVHRDP